jgi:hypothetical protein
VICVRMDEFCGSGCCCWREVVQVEGKILLKAVRTVLPDRGCGGCGAAASWSHALRALSITENSGVHFTDTDSPGGI